MAARHCLGQRLVNRGLLVVVGAQAATGLASLLTGAPPLRGTFDLHRFLAILFLLLLAFKVPVVWGALRRPRRNALTGLSLLLTGLILSANFVGWLVAAGWLPQRLPLGVTWLSVHVYLGLAALPLLLVHALLRWPRTRIPERPGRRLVLLGLPAAALALWIGGQRTRLLDRPVAGNPRFTGSVATTSFSGNDFPVTNWLFDNPDPIDPATYRLTLRDAAGRETRLALSALTETTTRDAILDCTSGWYTEQVWSGVAVADLLDQLGNGVGSTVRFRSITGHATELPLAEARACLLATHVGGEPLNHVHGAPLRLVAPERRGVAWVKWLDEIVIVS